MLEIRNLKKVYHSKNGNSVTALDGVNMSFPETGMVFVLGKSGSGKSTLLNVIGGLDGYDSGEFIIKGKSSKDFGGSDFDAYRNTFIGFIFQEYNILDDFTVGANIGLALELQGKKATNEKISNILGQVDMLDYAKRRPNELSGGQKQRIAIARALVKDPEIIMADEPTGALDSNTGKQIFDTLKELSKTKLVIVVSHDRDFAEKYGDRIIEMSDGKVVSDITKHQVSATSVSNGILQMNDNLLRIEKGYQLTAEDVKLINEYLKNQDAEIFVSGDKRLNDGVRATAGITDDNTSSMFKDTDEEKDVEKKSYEKKDSRFIRSRLPLKNALKIGSSSLGHKKFRLTVTIFLSLIAFTLFGFADSMGAYNKIVTATDSIIDTNITNASFSLGVKHTWVYDEGDEHIGYYTTAMNEDDIKSLSEKTGMSFIPVYNGTSGDNYGSQIPISQMMISTDKISSESAYTGNMYGFTAASAQELSSLNFSLIGHMPENEEQIVITEFLYRELNLTGFANTQYQERIEAGQITTDPQGGDKSIIGKHLTVRIQGMEYTFVVCGVMDTRFDYERYSAYVPTADSVINSDSDNIMEMIMINELSNTLEYGFHGLGYIHQERLDEMAEHTKYNMGMNSYIGINISGWNLSLEKPYDNGGGNGDSNSDFEKESGMQSKEAYVINPGNGIVIEEQIQNSMQIAYFHYIGQSEDIPQLGDISWLDGTPRTTLGKNEVLVPDSVFNNIDLKGDITDKVNAVLTKIYGKTAEDAPDAYSIGEIIREFENEKYKAYIFGDAFFNENKAQITEFYRDSFGLDAETPITDEELRDFWNSSADMYRIEGTQSSEDYFRKGYVAFFKELFGKNYNEQYSISFYDNLCNEISYDTGDNSFIIRPDGAARIMITEYAYNTVYSNPDICTDTDFVNKVIAQRYPTDEWLTKYKNTDEAANSYREYIMNYAHEGMEYYGSKGYADFEASGKDFFFAFTNMSLNGLLDDVYLSNMTWDYKSGNQFEEKLTQYKIVGTFTATGDSRSNLIISDDLYAAYREYMVETGMATEIVAPHEPGIYAFAITPMPEDREQIEKLVTLSYESGGDYIFTLQNQVMDTLDGFNSFIEVGAKIFLYIGIGFAVFSALMLMNFISVSISYKRREIGILRAVGARSSDVFKIFFCEAFIIALINYILSVIATIAATTVFNNIVRGEGINVTLLHFGIRQVILMFIISLAVAAIASFLPVWNIARKKPVDAIKNK